MQEGNLAYENQFSEVLSKACVDYYDKLGDDFAGQIRSIYEDINGLKSLSIKN